MKKRMAVMASIACLLMATGCKDGREIPYHKLPAKVQNFIETFFLTRATYMPNASVMTDTKSLK